MKCPKCGFESELTYPVCPQCQAEIQPNPAAAKILPALKDTLFLVICILMSAACVLSLAADGFPLLLILIAVFLWLTYTQSRKDIADAKHLRCVSGAVYADYVITYVGAAFVAIAGVLISLFIGFILSDPELLGSLTAELDGLDLAPVAEMLAFVPSGLIIAIFLIIAVAMVVLNIFSLRYMHRFVKSVYQSIETGVLKLEYVNATKIWLFIFGGINALSCLSSFSDGYIVLALSSGAESAVCILAGILIGRYFFDAPVLTNAEVDKATSVFADHQQFLDSDIR